MTSPCRIGVMTPLGTPGATGIRRAVEDLERLGYDDLWVGEVNDADAVTTLAFAAAYTERIGLGTAVLPVFTRGPAVLATTAAALAALAPGRVTIGLGASSPAIVEGWNGGVFERPLARTRDTVRFLRAALAGARIDENYTTFTASGFQLANPPAEPPPILVAGLRPGMLHVARDEADGAIVNWCSADDIPRFARELDARSQLVVRLFVCPTADADTVRAVARRQITAYLTVPAYAAFQRWAGRGEQLEPMWRAWDAGDRRGALAAVPDDLVDALVVHGSPRACADHLARFAANGATGLAFSVLEGVVDPLRAVHDLGAELVRMRSAPPEPTYDLNKPISEPTHFNAPVETNEMT